MAKGVILDIFKGLDEMVNILNCPLKCEYCKYFIDDVYKCEVPLKTMEVMFLRGG